MAPKSRSHQNTTYSTAAPPITAPAHHLAPVADPDSLAQLGRLDGGPLTRGSGADDEQVQIDQYGSILPVARERLNRRYGIGRALIMIEVDGLSIVLRNGTSLRKRVPVRCHVFTHDQSRVPRSVGPGPAVGADQLRAGGEKPGGGSA